MEAKKITSDELTEFCMNILQQIVDKFSEYDMTGNDFIIFMGGLNISIYDHIVKYNRKLNKNEMFLDMVERVKDYWHGESNN